MGVSERAVANRVLAMNTLAFTVCFAVWTMYGVLITFLVDQRVLELDKVQIGWLIGIPILTGSLLRLPVGYLADRYGGRPVFFGVMVFSAIACFFTGSADTFTELMIAGLAFGTAGASFAVGIAYSSIWFPKEKQGTALGIFGVGNAGAALTSLGAPHLLNALTAGPAGVEGWRMMPKIYAGGLALTAVLFWLLTVSKKPETSGRTMADMMRPLRDVRVWRFGLYYFLVFGGFVALAQWLIPYYLNVYSMTLATAGMMAAIFSLPSGVVRALGGWASDKFGARATMYWVLSACTVFFLLLLAPRMSVRSPGEGILAERAGVVTFVSSERIEVDDKSYALKKMPEVIGLARKDTETLVFPTFQSWNEPNVEVGAKVSKREVLARGVTNAYFQANVWIFTALVFLAGIMMGIGKAAVYKHIPEYFPNDVGVVGGIVGVLGGLGGFVCPILFGYMLRGTGLWTTCWLFLGAVSIICLVWMHIVILKMTRDMVPAGMLDRE